MSLTQQLAKVKQLADAWERMQAKIAHTLSIHYSFLQRAQSIQICCNVRRVACASWRDKQAGALNVITVKGKPAIIRISTKNSLVFSLMTVQFGSFKIGFKGGFTTPCGHPILPICQGISIKRKVMSSDVLSLTRVGWESQSMILSRYVALDNNGITIQRFCDI